jgi:hypothetical protein
MVKMRHATPLDLLSIAATRRRQHVLRLNPPYTLVQPNVLLRDLVRSQIPFRSQSSFVYVCVDGGTVLGYVQARCRWRKRDAWAITTVAVIDKAPDAVWEALIEAVCRAAGEAGVTRVCVKVPHDEPRMPLFHNLGFTRYANETIWGNLYLSSSGPADEPPHGPLRRQRGQDAWDLMRLYAAVTPPVVQRAEDLSTHQWQVDRMFRPWFLSDGLLENSYVWADESGQKQGLGGYIRLLTGPAGHWIYMLPRPDPANRAVCSLALDYVLWKAARAGSKPVYCGVREYQAEVGGLLEERGFHPLSDQALLIKYLVEPLRERQPALVRLLVPDRGEMLGGRVPR